MVDYKPTFILGNPRSGTSLFRLMLNSHSKIVAPPESGFAHWLLDSYSNWNDQDNTSVRLDRFLSDLRLSKKFETWNLSIEVLRNTILYYKPSNYSDLIALIYLSYSEKVQPGQIIVDKNNYYIQHIKDLPKIWPNTKYLHLVRDGRDVVCSYLDVVKLETTSLYKPKFSSSIEEIAKEWCINNRRIAGIKKYFPEQYLLVKYENLILDTKNELLKVCDFLEIKFDNKMLYYYEQENQKKREPVETLDWKLKTLEKPDINKVFRFKEYLSKKQLVLFELNAMDVLKVYGYKQS